MSYHNGKGEKVEAVADITNREVSIRAESDKLNKAVESLPGKIRNKIKRRLTRSKSTKKKYSEIAPEENKETTSPEKIKETTSLENEEEPKQNIENGIKKNINQNLKISDVSKPSNSFTSTSQKTTNNENEGSIEESLKMLSLDRNLTDQDLNTISFVGHFLADILNIYNVITWYVFSGKINFENFVRISIIIRILSFLWQRLNLPFKQFFDKNTRDIYQYYINILIYQLTSYSVRMAVAVLAGMVSNVWHLFPFSELFHPQHVQTFINTFRETLPGVPERIAFLFLFFQDFISVLSLPACFSKIPNFIFFCVSWLNSYFNIFSKDNREKAYPDLIMFILILATRKLRIELMPYIVEIEQIIVNFFKSLKVLIKDLKKIFRKPFFLNATIKQPYPEKVMDILIQAIIKLIDYLMPYMVEIKKIIVGFFLILKALIKDFRGKFFLLIKK